jgi:UDP-N-acetylglucosamine 2-epimerase
MYKIMTIVGTRPELIKMSRLIALLDEISEHILVHTGQNYDYELNQVFFEDLEIRKPDFFLNVADTSLAKTIGKIIEKSDEVFESQQPDALLVYGDTNSCLSVIAAKRRKIPIFHMEAGNRCFDQRVPEELNRKVVDHLSDVNLVLTEHARRYLLAEGIRPQYIFKTGSNMFEVLNYYKKKIQDSKILGRLNLKSKNYFLVSLHREENVDTKDNLEKLTVALNRITEFCAIPVIVSMHPRTKKRIEDFNLGDLAPQVQIHPPFGFFDYIKLQISSKCVISDSGTIFEENSILNFPAVTIRNAHERPEGMDASSVILSNLEPKNIVLAVKAAILFSKKRFIHRPVVDYEAKNASEHISRIILSYINNINSQIWRKGN